MRLVPVFFTDEEKIFAQVRPRRIMRLQYNQRYPVVSSWSK